MFSLSFSFIQYRHTFFSIETGKQMNIRVFSTGNDVMRAEIFTQNKAYWLPIKDKVDLWLKRGWATWEEEKPEWFTDKWRYLIPKDMIPTKHSTGLKRLRTSRGLSGSAMTESENEGEAGSSSEDEDDDEGGGGRSCTRGSGFGNVSGRFNLTASRSLLTGGAGTAKIAPQDVNPAFDEIEFIRELKRRGSISL